MADIKKGGFYERLTAIMAHYGIGSINELAINYLKYKASEKLNRLKNEDNKPSVEILGDILRRWPEINANWLLTGKGEMILGSTNKLEAETPEVSPWNVLMVLAEGYKAQVETIKSIEKNMARQDSQAKLEANLTEVLAGVESLAFFRSTDMKEIRESLSRLQPDKNPPSQGSGRKKHGTDGDGQKRGKRVT